jgi:hypothetical protein
MTNTQHHSPSSTADALHRPDAAGVAAAMEKRSFAMLSTVSPAGIPHAAAVLYEIVGSAMYVNTSRNSRKALNVAANGRVGVCIPIRRFPVGPPSSVQFQARAAVLDLDDPAITAAFAAGELSSLTKHGELDLPDDCFLLIALPRRLATYGLGMSIRTLVKDPLGAAGVVETSVPS